jgi:hypothetical protein
MYSDAFQSALLPRFATRSTGEERNYNLLSFGGRVKRGRKLKAKQDNSAF